MSSARNPLEASLTRRQALLAGATLAAGTALAACGTPAAATPAKDEAGILPGIQLGLPFPRGSGVAMLGTLGIGFCFGALQPIAGVKVDHVAGAYRDDYNSMVAQFPVHNLKWWQQNHPDWVVYLKDGKTPASVGDPNANGEIVLDISNPKVQQYQFDNFLKPYIQQGWTRVGFDNVFIINPNGWSGVYRNGKFVKLYSGHQVDPAIQQTWVTWAKGISTLVKSYNSKIKIDVNYSWRNNAGSAYSLLLPYFDGFFDERGFTNWGGAFSTGSEFDGIFNAQKLLRQQGKLVFLNGEVHVTLPSSATTRSNATLNQAEQLVTQAQLLWVIGTYLLVKARDYYTWESAYFELQGSSIQDYNHFIYRPEYYLPIGSPLNDAYLWQDLYRRDYTGGMVLVNSGTAAATVKVGSLFHPLHDANGQKVSSVTLKPAQATVLTYKVSTAPQQGNGLQALPQQLMKPLTYAAKSSA